MTMSKKNKFPENYRAKNITQYVKVSQIAERTSPDPHVPIDRDTMLKISSKTTKKRWTKEQR